MRYSLKRTGVARPSIALLLLAGAALAGCGGGDPSNASSATAAEQAAAAKQDKAEKAASLDRALALARKTNDARVKSERLRRGEPAR